MSPRSQGSVLWIRCAERGLIAGFLTGLAAGFALTRIRRHRTEPCLICEPGTWRQGGAGGGAA